MATPRRCPLCPRLLNVSPVPCHGGVGTPSWRRTASPIGGSRDACARPPLRLALRARLRDGGDLPPYLKHPTGPPVRCSLCRRAGEA